MPRLSELRDRALLRLLRLPPAALRRLTGGAISREGRTLDAQAQMFCFLAERFAPRTFELTPAQARRQFEESAPVLGGAPRPVRRLEDFDLGGGVRARLYAPYGAPKPAPLVVYFHGGGFVTGSIATHDRTVRLLADTARVPLLSVEYRLAPEHRFPAAVDDALRAYLWARENAARLGADGARVAVAGDSAGGNLAAVVSRAATDAGVPPPALQVLVYPATDFTKSSPSHRTFARGFFLEERSIDYYLGHYGADPTDPRASPLLAKGHGGLPPAIVATAGFDPLVDEGDAYARKLMGAGVRVSHVRHDALIHGFASFCGAFGEGQRATEALGREIGRMLA